MGGHVEMPGEKRREVKSAQVWAGLHMQEASADTVPGFPLFDQELVNVTPLGSELSPLLSNLVLERGLEVPQRVQCVIVYTVCFADDLTIIVDDESSIQDAR